MAVNMNTIPKFPVMLILDTANGISEIARGATHVQIDPLGGSTTVQVQARLDASASWVQIGTDITSTAGALIDVSKYNFVQVVRTAGTGPVMAWAQLSKPE